MDEQWGSVGAKSRQRWLFYAYDSLRKTVVAHVFGERTMATLGRLMSLLSPFDVVIWMTDGWPLYESRLKANLPYKYQLNLRQFSTREGTTQFQAGGLSHSDGISVALHPAFTTASAAIAVQHRDPRRADGTGLFGTCPDTLVART